jgi:hypothetical protein
VRVDVWRRATNKARTLFVSRGGVDHDDHSLVFLLLSLVPTAVAKLSSVLGSSDDGAFVSSLGERCGEAEADLALDYIFS